MTRLPRIAILFAALASPAAYAQTQAGWETVEGIGYVCGGASQESLDRLKAMRDSAHVELVFTHGEDKSPLQGVDFSILGPVAAPLRLQSQGPVCLIRLPKGEHIIEADFRGAKRTQRIRAGEQVQKVTFSWGG